ncbi:hypothetical protein D3C78_18980 [compost metagenome]
MSGLLADESMYDMLVNRIGMKAADRVAKHIDYVDGTADIIDIQRWYQFPHVSNESIEHFAESLISLGNYLNFVRVAGLELETLSDGQGFLGEAVYFSPNRKSCIAVLNGVAVALQFSNKWTAYKKNKGLNYPWINAIREKFLLPVLSPYPRIEITRYGSTLLKVGYTLWAGIYSNHNLHQMQVDEDRRSPSDFDAYLYCGVGTRARCVKLSIEVIERNGYFKHKVVEETVERDLLDIQKDIESKLLLYRNPYIESPEDDDYLYIGQSLIVQSYGNMWVSLGEGAWVPINAEAMTILTKRSPDHPVSQEYLMYANTH